MSRNRRFGLRVPARLLINQYVADWHHQSISFNLSPEGIFLYHQRMPDSKVVSLEFKLPGQEDSVWAKGEVRYRGRFGDYLGAGIAFTAMANKHWDMVHDWVLDTRLENLKRRLGMVNNGKPFPLAA